MSCLLSGIHITGSITQPRGLYLRIRIMHPSLLMQSNCPFSDISSTIDLYPLLRNYDVWGETVGINWNAIGSRKA